MMVRELEMRDMAKTKNNTAIDQSLYNAFWRKLQQSKYDIIYYDLHFKECVSISRKIKYTVVGLTSLATGAWMSWSGNAIICVLCPIIIFILQAVSAVSDLFPFENRKIELRELSTELEQLYIEMETDWRKIQALEITNESIRSLIEKYALRQADISKHYFKDDALPIKERIRTKADNLTEEYYKNFI